MATTPASRIQVLPDQLVNRIAAGEVIERPASVVKELLDNAIDAGADRVALTIEDGGKQLIRIADNGGGMNQEELRLSVMPHATSKITCDEDLYHIATMGFRGEALASISAVAKMRIVTRQPDSDEGFEVRVSGKEMQLAQAVGTAPGTTVEVRDLFFNVPARRRFLRANSTESGHINEQVGRAALALPGIAFDVTNNGRSTQSLPPASTRLERIAKLYGVELADALMVINRQERGLTIEAYAAPPAQSRANTQWQYTFANGRYIRDKYVQHAIKEAYRGLMEPNRNAVIFLFLQVDPETVDVNVHPTKIEVRWANSNLIHSAVLSVLRETFQQCDLTPALSTAKATAHRSVPQRQEFSAVSDEERQRLLAELAAEFKTSQPVQPDRDPPAYSGDHAAPGSEQPDYPPLGAGIYDRSRETHAGGGQPRYDRPSISPSHPGAREAWQQLYRPTSPDPGYAAADRPLPGSSPTDQPGSEAFDPSRIGGAATAEGDAGPLRPAAIQMHNMYLVIEDADGIIIVDQHALHERVMYDFFRRRIADGKLESQRLLLPESIRVTASQAALLQENIDLLAKMGIEIKPDSGDAMAILAFPSLLKDSDVAAFMRDLLDAFDQRPGGVTSEILLEDLLSMMACKAAVKAGDPLTDDEIQALVAHRGLIEKSSNCPHGRPTMLRFTKADLERQFHRT